MKSLLQDVRYGLRMLRKSPGFTAVAIITLALGIGANTAIFTIADAILLKSLPVHEPQRLVQVLQPDGPGLQEYGEYFSFSDFHEMSERASAFVRIAGESQIRQVSASIGTAIEEPLERAFVSPNYFEVLGVAPAIGHVTTAADAGDQTQQSVAIISYDLWKRRFGLDPGVLGRTIRIDSNIFQVIGVTQPGFFGLEVGSVANIWTSIPAETRQHLSLRLIGRLNPGATAAQAARPIQSLFHQHMVDMIGHAPPGTPGSLIDHILRLTVKVIPAGKGFSSLRAEYGKPVQIVFGLVALILLVACTTVATLLEARINLRQPEAAVRNALGAGRWRLIRQLLIENMLIGLAAAGFGLVLAHWTTPLVVRLLAPSNTPVQLILGLDRRVLGFTAFVCIVTTLAFGFVPAWRFSKANINCTLKGNTTLSRSHARTGKILVASQVALSLIVVMGTTLFVRTLRNLSTFDAGFARENVLLSSVRFRGPDHGERLHLAWEELLRRAAAVPGIESASLSSGSIFNGAFGNGALRIRGIPPNPRELAACIFFQASPNFFGTMGTPLLKGRDFQPRDFSPSALPVAVVSESLARHFFGDDNPLGREFSNFEDNPPRWVTVIGVAKDAKFENLRDPAPMVAYLPFTWPRVGTMLTLAMRTRADTATMASTLRREASIADPEFTIGQITTQSQIIGDTVVRERLLSVVASFFGALALLMAAVGLYGIMSYTVTQRTREIGVRMALGATPREILGMVLLESELVVGVGAAIGIGGAEAAARLISALLFGVRAQDLSTVFTAVSLLLAVALVAAFIPARRAAQVDPMVALRYE